MYCAFYGIEEKPFSITPDPKYLYLGKTHKEAFAHLVYGIRERGGFIVVTGDIGTGKTTLCRALLNHLDADTLIAFIFNPTLSALELLKSINEDYGICSEGDTQKELIDELNRFLLEKRQEGKNTVLIIDEAQNLDMEVLEHIRLLSNLETDTEKLLQIILIGQPEFRQMLEEPRLLQLNQRVTVRYHLKPLSREEADAYVHHRLSVAGAEDKVRFSSQALKRIARYTKGVPRLINVLCDRALLAGYGARTRDIDGQTIDQAYKEVIGDVSSGRFSFLRRLIRHPLFQGTVIGVILAGIIHVWMLSGKEIRQGKEPAPELAKPESVPAPDPIVFVPEPPPVPPVPSDRALPAIPDEVSMVVDDTLPLETADLAETPVLAQDSAEGLVSSLMTAPTQEAQAAVDGTAREEWSPFSGKSLPVPPAEPAPEIGREGELLSKIFTVSLSDMTILETRNLSFQAVVREWSGLYPSDGLQVENIVTPDLYQAADLLGFLCYRIEGNFNRIKTLNLPTILELMLGEDVGRRYVALLSIDGPYARISPALSDSSYLVPISMLEDFWHGTAYVMWKDWTCGGRLVLRGMRGETVRWLQASLRSLGYLDVEVTGAFDNHTVEALQAFQNDHYLDEDGILGPQTKIVLYQALAHFKMPRLAGGALQPEDGRP